MMLIFSAKSIMKAVRGFYAGHGPKSNNKVYMHSEEEVIGYDDFDKRRTIILTKMSSGDLKQKHEKRNKNADRVGLKFDGTGLTPRDRGESIWRKGEGGADIAGNCCEMAFVSAYLAIADHHIDPKTVWIAIITPPGDHAFCLIGPSSKPTWANVNEMGIYGTSTGSAVVIDPWLHQACHVVNYPEFANNQVKKWQRDGKRIAWYGKDGKKPGWYDPSRTYANAFLTSRLLFLSSVAQL